MLWFGKSSSSASATPINLESSQTGKNCSAGLSVSDDSTSQVKECPLNRLSEGDSTLVSPASYTSCPRSNDTSSSRLTQKLNPNVPTLNCPVQYAAGSRSDMHNMKNRVNETVGDNESDNSSSYSLAWLNPLNYMPFQISQNPAPGQTHVLPVERTFSSIRRGDKSHEFWEYPSPQQMYNAMLRKGYTDTPADAVESMVAVHNYLNEGAWSEILRWEKSFAYGLRQGWRNCLSDAEKAFSNNACSPSESSISEAASGDNHRVNQVWDNRELGPEPSLVRFIGRPDDLTPKARILQLLGWISPSHFHTECPFDRHDWYIRRTNADGETCDVRYVIDFYDATSDDGQGQPVFYLDVRPAVDTPDAVARRILRCTANLCYRMSRVGFNSSIISSSPKQNSRSTTV